MDANTNPSVALPRYNGFRHIIDDGDCQDHGYHLPKLRAKSLKIVCNCGVEYAEMSDKDLLAVLDGASTAQQKILARLK
jgi:hypothetical protein